MKLKFHQRDFIAIDQTTERISKLEDRTFEITDAQELKEKQKRTKKT